MVHFRGSLNDFLTHIEPRIKNVVNSIARRDRNARGGMCQHCECTFSELDSAHIHGHGRRDIIEEVLQKYTDQSGIIDCSLNDVEVAIIQRHYPIANHFIFLCKQCHFKYDNIIKSAKTYERKEKHRNVGQTLELLPISISPSDVVEFKKMLLLSRRAVIWTHYADGRIRQRPWRAERFDASSNLFGNLRSRPEFRQGVWQELGIERIHVEVR